MTGTTGTPDPGGIPPLPADPPSVGPSTSHSGHPPQWAWWVIGIVVPVLGIAATLLATSNKSGSTAAPTPPATTAPHDSPTPGPPSSSASTPEGSPAAPPPASSPTPTPTGSKQVSLTTLDPVAYTSFGASTATLDGKAYDDSLVSSAPCPFRGDIEFNLGKQWKKINLAAGMDDNSVPGSVVLTISADDEVLFRGSLSLGSVRELHLDITDKLHMNFHYDGGGSGCDGSKRWIVLGNPSLSN